MFKLGIVTTGFCFASYFFGANSFAEVPGAPPLPIPAPAPAIAPVPVPKPNTNNFCITNAADVEKQKDNLPTYFQSLPVTLGADTQVPVLLGMKTDVIVILTILPRQGTLVLNSDVWKLNARYPETIEIAKVCFEPLNENMTITFSNKTTFAVKYKPHEVDTGDVKLHPLSRSKIKELSDKMKAREAAKLKMESMGGGSDR